MIETVSLFPGITLRCFPDSRFKQGALSLQIVRPMCREEVAQNALLPAVLLRGCKTAPDLRSITKRLDDLYGASVGCIARRVGDYQTTGLYAGFIDDRFAMDGDRILAPVIGFVRDLLLDPLTENGVFRSDFVAGEKKNLISTIESQRNDKRSYAAAQLLKKMCGADSFGIPRLGEKEQVAAITPEGLFEHYKKILRQSRIDLFYVGSAEPKQVASLLKPVFEGIERDYVNLPEQTALSAPAGGDHTEEMAVTQGKLAMGFVTPITNRDDRFVAMQVCNVLFGGGMTSKLFMQVRETLSLCYDIGSGYRGAKGVLTVQAGIDFDKVEQVREQVLRLLADCQNGNITEEELVAAKQTVVSGLRGTHDSPGAIESYYSTAALSGLNLTPAQYREKVEKVTLAQVVEAAKTVSLHTTYFLKGVAQ